MKQINPNEEYQLYGMVTMYRHYDDTMILWYMNDDTVMEDEKRGTCIIWNIKDEKEAVDNLVREDIDSMLSSPLLLLIYLGIFPPYLTLRGRGKILPVKVLGKILIEQAMG